MTLPMSDVVDLWPNETTDKPTPPPETTCPWCGAPVTEQTNADRAFLGWTFVRRTYRCEDCAVTIHVDGDATRAP